MYNPKDEYFVLVKAIEDQMFGKPWDDHSPYVSQFRRSEGAWCACSWAPDHAGHGRRNRFLPALC
jgi:hypothetical protein